MRGIYNYVYSDTTIFFFFLNMTISTKSSSQLITIIDNYTTLQEGSTCRRFLYLHRTFIKDIHADAGFEPAIPVSEQPQTNTLDRAATGIGLRLFYSYNLRYVYCYVTC